MQIDHYVHPIFAKEGNYPQRLIDMIEENSAKEGRNTSRLRPFTPKQVEYIKGTGDFIGLNHYATEYVSRNSSLEGRFAVPSLQNDMYFITSFDPSWPFHGWVHVSKLSLKFLALIFFQHVLGSVIECKAWRTLNLVGPFFCDF